MSSGEQVPKKVLIDQIRRTIIDGESSLLTILTDNKRSIMFRFSEGRLIRSHCRSRNVADAIAALNECKTLKFTQAGTQPQDQPELIGAEDLLRAIAPDEFVEKPAAAHTLDIIPEPRQLVEKVSTPTPVPAPPTRSNDGGAPIDPTLENEFTKIAGDYIGRVADVLVPNIFAKRLSVVATIDEIAAAIPVAKYSDAFRKRAEDFTGSTVAEKPKEPEHRLFF